MFKNVCVVKNFFLVFKDSTYIKTIKKTLSILHANLYILFVLLKTFSTVVDKSDQQTWVRV